MAKSRDLADFERVVEKIIFKEDELEKLKITVKNFSEGKTSAKDLKGLLLQCRGRMVQEITDFAFFIVDTQTKEYVQTEKIRDQSILANKVESQLNEEIREKNELLDKVAHRINQLVSRLNNEDSIEDQKQILIDDAKHEIDRCLNQIGAKNWIEMCYYDDYKFFDKFYPKLEALYEERFGESKRSISDTNNGKETMANKMMKLGFPKDIEKILIQYVKIRNNFQHTMDDISPSNLGLAHEAFIKIFIYLILSSLESKILLNNRETIYSCLIDFFSKQLKNNQVFRKKILERIETVF